MAGRRVLPHLFARAAAIGSRGFFVLKLQVGALGIGCPGSGSFALAFALGALVSSLLAGPSDPGGGPDLDYAQTVLARVGFVARTAIVGAIPRQVVERKHCRTAKAAEGFLGVAG